MTRAPRPWLVLTGLLAWLAAVDIVAAFNAGVGPPRFELGADPGETLREVVSIVNSGDLVETYVLRTADWDLTPSGGVVVHPPELQPGSCRPWTRIERREVRLAPQEIKRYRFEVSVPADAPVGECRFALLIESAPPATDGTELPQFSVQLPIAARLAVIVYVTIGDAAPSLRVEQARMRETRGRLLPVLTVRNVGGAHGRPGGFLNAEDARGERYELLVVPAPVLAGQVSEIVLQPDPALYGNQPPDWQPPLRLRGDLETGAGVQTLDLIAR